MPRPPDLVGAIRHVLETKNAAESDRLSLHVSDLAVSVDTADGGACPRALWLRLRQAERTPPHAGHILMWDAGYRLQDAALEWLREGLDGWTVLAVEKDVRLGRIVGRCDTVLRGPEGEIVVLDFKTLRGRAFQYMEGPKLTHLLQVQSYVMALDADYGMLLYLDREGQNFARQHYVERNDSRVRAAMSEAERVESSAEPPPVLEPVSKRNGKLALPWQCEWCPFYNVSCNGADVTGIDAALQKVETNT